MIMANRVWVRANARAIALHRDRHAGANQEIARACVPEARLNVWRIPKRPPA